MKINTKIRPVVMYLDVEVLSIMEVKKPRKTHKCHRCGSLISGRHLKMAMMNLDEFMEVRECLSCTAELRHLKDESLGAIGSVYILDEK